MRPEKIQIEGSLLSPITSYHHIYLTINIYVVQETKDTYIYTIIIYLIYSFNHSRYREWDGKKYESVMFKGENLGFYGELN